MFRQLTDKVVKQFETPEGARSADLDFSLVRKGSQFWVQQAENEKLFATNDAVAPGSQVLGDVAESGARLAQEFPGLTIAATQASLAITALGAAAAIKTGADLLPASFRGIAFDCLYTREVLARDTVVYEYP
ncbi:MAG: hypothetical protein ACR5LG_13395 [Sodalis sp. (in: enterobacteria)]|uniref:hypothetical protein n=1 Tax=Sodalis sp. (in: enterobacteria) TaxID=1898979 RepID=UPI003F31DFF9